MRTQFRFKLKKQETAMRFIQPAEEGVLISKRLRLILSFKKFVLRYIVLFFVLVFLLLYTFRYLYMISNHYKSEATISFGGFEIPEYDDNQNSHIPIFAQMKEGLNRLYSMVYSKEMFDHLIEKFDLYTHFELDKKDPRSYGALRRILKSEISLFQGVNKVIAIQVTDPYSGKMSADIANELISKANEMNRKYITEKIENRIKLYEKLHREIKSQTDDDIRELKPQITLLNEVLSKYAMKNVLVDQSALALKEQSGKIEEDISQLVELSKVNNWSLNSLQDNIISNVLVLQDALPGEEEMNISLWILIPVALLSSCMVALFIFYLAYKYQPYLRLLTAS